MPFLQEAVMNWIWKYRNLLQIVIARDEAPKQSLLFRLPCPSELAMTYIRATE